MTRSAALLLLLLLVALFSLSDGTQVFVRSTSSSDSGACTSDSPCATILTALSQLPDDGGAHVVVLMAASQPLTGTGNGNLATLQIAGTSGRSISFVGDTEGTQTVIDLGSASRFATIVGSGISVTLRNLRLLHGFTSLTDPSGSFGGFILVDLGAQVTASDCNFESGNCDGLYEESQGGAFYCGDATRVFINSSYFFNNSAGVGGALSCRKTTTVVITNSEMAYNFHHSGGWGGTILAEDYSTNLLVDSYFHDNVTPGGFGGVLDDGTAANTTFRRCFFTRNGAFSGAVYYSYGSTSMTFEDCTMTNNTVESDSTVMSLTSASTVQLSNCLIEGNVVPTASGTVLVTGSAVVSIRDTVFANNTAAVGGAIMYNANVPLLINNCSFLYNTASAYGGAISVSQPMTMDTDYAVLVTNSTFVGNLGTTEGGAFQIDSSLLAGVVPVLLDTVYFEANEASDGGSLHLTGSAKLTTAATQLGRTTFNANVADRYGGGIYLTGTATIALSAVDFASNSAFNGGALYVSQTSNISIVDATFDKNEAFLGGAISLNDGSAVTALTDVAFSANTALNGAALYLNQDDSADLCFACEDDAVVSFIGNKASRAGPAIFWVVRSRAFSAACSPNELVCSSAVLENNTASYGTALATSPSSITQLVMSSDSQSVFSGSVLTIAGVLTDALNQTVLSASEVLELELAIDYVEPSSVSSIVVIRGATIFQPSDDGSFLNQFEVPLDINSYFELVNDSSSSSSSSEAGKRSSSSYPLMNISFALSGFPASLESVTVNTRLNPNCPDGYIRSYLPASNFTMCLQNIPVSVGGRIGLGVGLGLTLILAILLFMWQLRMRKAPVVRAGDPQITSIITFGLGLAIVAAFMWFDNNDAMCALRPWLLGIATSLVYACLVVKQWRLKFIFDKAANFESAHVERPQLMAFIAAIQLLPTLIILIVWFSVSPYVQKIVIDWDALTYSQLCGSSYQALDTTMISLLLVVNVIVMGLGIILSLVSGSVFSNFNEAHYLGLCMYALGIALAIVTPLVIIFPDDVDIQFFVPVIAILAVVFATLLIIYGQKLFVIYFPERAALSLQRDVNDVALRIGFLSGDPNVPASVPSSRSSSGSMRSSAIVG